MTSMRVSECIVSRFGGLLTNNRSRCGPTQCTANFEQEDGHQKRRFSIVKLVYFAEEWIEDCAREHIATTIPAYIRDSAVCVCDCRYSSSYTVSVRTQDGGILRTNDHAVESNKEEGQIDRDDDEPKLERFGLIVLLGICVLVASRG